MRRRYVLGARVAVIAAVCAAVLSTVPRANAGQGRAGDFDNDGYDDLAIGVPDEALGPINDGGAVNVLRGSASGITATGDQLFTQATLGGNEEALDRFGNALAYGDFDGDGYGDLAVGAPTEDYGGAVDAGVVHIVFGSAAGLNVGRRQLLTQLGAMAGANEPGDFFGATLAAGDFNGDGRDDLAIGTPGEDIGGHVAAGGVVIAYGSGGGITTSGSRLLSQAGATPGTPEDFDAFAGSLASGDFDGDGRDDLAVGVPGEDIGARADSGGMNIFLGAASGLSPGGLFVSQRGKVPGAAEAGDLFGYSLAVCDFDADGNDDVAIGSPGEAIGSLNNAGAVTVLYGNASGVRRSGGGFFSQGGPVPGVPEAGDRFGFVVAAGDFNNDGDCDLAVGAPGEDIAGRANSGSVSVLGGAAGTGLSATGNLNLAQPNLPGLGNEAGDGLGRALRVGDFNGDGFDDLAIGVPFEDRGQTVDSGTIVVVYGSSGSLARDSAKVFNQSTPGVEGASEANDRFGVGL